MTIQLDPAQLRALVEDVRKPREAIEAAFVDAGDRLSEGASLLNTLTRLFEAMPSALQGEEVGAAVQHLDAVSGRALTLSERFDFEKTDLDSLVGVVTAASSPIDALRRTIKMMGIVSINARVTAAGIVGNDDDFEVFTADIKTLSDTAGKTIQEFAQVYRQLADEVSRASLQRSAFESTHSNTLSTLAQNLSTAITGLNQHQFLAAESSIETGRVGRQITGRIGSTVMALQVGDATRQRLEHVEALLSALSTLAENGSFEGEAIAPEHLPLCLAALAALQDELFGDCIDTFADEVSAAQNALRELVSDASIIISLSKEFQGDGKGSGSAISTLNVQVGTAVTTVNDFEGERGKLEATSISVQELVRKLLEHVEAVQEIEASMHLVSLNTAVRCAQMGPRGAPLTIIAMQLRELTAETVTAAQAAMEQLTKATAFASKLHDAEAQSADGPVGELERRAKAALAILLELDQRISVALKQLNSDAPRVIRLLEAAERGLEGQTRLVERLDAIKAEIEALRGEDTPEQLPDALKPIFAKLRKLYTMEAERQIHDRLVGAPVVAATAAASAAPAAADDDIFFGFDEPDAPASESSDLGDFDLFEAAPPAAIEAPAEEDVFFDDFGTEPEPIVASPTSDIDGFELLSEAPEVSVTDPEPKKKDADDLDDIFF
ncbi:MULTISPECIES: hypothetical protein [unclassified Devosia]|uniref:hypothetical protein n=1 Tax=unclassified Devosia TaxID=196773 RepID=UPI00145CBC2D|nr:MULTISPECIES: hypothetical protein [unclassified Devosia]MBJ6987744.1 hypothetical protein [Devosia sp. MC521]QMW62418.1 hypothetical protein H4N61_16090 [Devosia sp. MC521]